MRAAVAQCKRDLAHADLSLWSRAGFMRKLLKSTLPRHVRRPAGPVQQPPCACKLRGRSSRLRRRDCHVAAVLSSAALPNEAPAPLQASSILVARMPW